MTEGEGRSESRTFSYHRSVAPLVWALVALATIELVVTHAFLAWWWPRVALVISAATAAGIGWLCWATAAMRTRPVVVGADRLLLRAGAIKAITVPIQAVAAIDAGGWTAAEIKAASTLNLALLAWPNIVVRLAHPIGRRRIMAIAHRLDDPAGFAAAVEALRSAA